MDNSLYRLPAVMQATGLPRSSAYWHVKQRLLPTPIKLGVRAVAWPRREIDAICNARIAGKTDKEIRALVVKLENERAVAA